MERPNLESFTAPVSRLFGWIRDHLLPASKFWRWTLSLGFLGLMSGTLGIGLWLYQSGIFQIDESRLDLIVNYEHSDNSLVFDRNGVKIGEFFSDYHVYTPIASIPKPMIDAVIAIEDRNFWVHKGVDFKAILRAAIAVVRHGRASQGASTITQQVVRNFLLTPEKSFTRKIKEAAFSLALERRISKERILEIYLNALFLGQGSYGVAAAAQRHFGKPLDQLDVHEMALIAGLFQSPSRYNPHKNPKAAKARQVRVLRAMRASKVITTAEFKDFKNRPLTYKPPASMNQSIAPFFVDAIQEQVEKQLGSKVKGKGLRIVTTLDLSLQEEMNRLLQNSNEIYSAAAQKLIHVKNPNPAMIEAASLIMNHRTGEILTMIGGRNFQRSQFNRTLKAKRQSGSCFKPVVYAQALMNGYNWSDMTYITPVVIQNYRPQNAAGEWLSEATLYNAFYRSINTPVVEIGAKLGIKKVIELAGKMGVKTPLKNQAGTLLGGSEMTMLELAQVYGTIGNEGQHVEPFMIQRITTRDGELVFEAKPTKPEKVLPPAIAYLLTDAMRAVFKHGTASRFPELAAFAAGKTGTTNDAKDNWFCGFTHDYTAMVWVGTDENYAFRGDVAGNTMALPIWSKMMTRLHQKIPQAAFLMPDGVELKRINAAFGYADENGLEMPLLIGRGPTRTESTLSIVRDSGGYRDTMEW